MPDQHLPTRPWPLPGQDGARLGRPAEMPGYSGRYSEPQPVKHLGHYRIYVEKGDK